MKPVPYKTLIKQVYFSLYNAVKVLKLMGKEEKQWQNLQSLGVQFENYMTCNTALTVCRVHTTTWFWSISQQSHNRNGQITMEV